MPKQKRIKNTFKSFGERSSPTIPPLDTPCKRNKKIRKKQSIPHSSSAKSLARKGSEMKSVTERNVTQELMWDVTHKRKDGSYVNEDAREIGEKIQEHMNQSTSTSEISPHDAVGGVLGPEHPGHVRDSNRLQKMEEKIQALCTYFCNKEGGRIPEELAGIFSYTKEAPANNGSGVAEPADARSSSNGSNGCSASQTCSHS